jgi:hypothetical protein
MHPEQADKHKTGQGLFGDIANKGKSFTRKHKDLIKGIIGDVLKGLISMTGLCAKKKRGRPRKTTATKKGKGILSSIVKDVGPVIIVAAANVLKGKLSGMGVKRVGRPRKKANKKENKKPKTRRVGRPRKGGGLIVPGYSPGQ